jgi:hypothetical protein
MVANCDIILDVATERRYNMSEGKGSSIMSDNELQQYLADLKAFAGTKHTKEEALRFLVGAGICKPDGTLAEPYNNNG